MTLEETFELYNKEVKETKEQSLKWWGELLYNKQQEYNYKINHDFLSWLSNKQILELFIKEHMYCVSSKVFETGEGCKEWCYCTSCIRYDCTPKTTISNKQEYNEEVFLDYLNKFTEQDKLKMLEVLTNKLK